MARSAVGLARVPKLKPCEHRFVRVEDGATVCAAKNCGIEVPQFDIVLITIPFLPPSSNHSKIALKGGGRANGPEVIAFFDAVTIISRRKRVSGESYFVDVTYWLLGDGPAFRKNDLDNFNNVTFNALTKAGVIVDDSLILDSSQHKRFTLDARQVRTDIVVQNGRVWSQQKCKF